MTKRLVHWRHTLWVGALAVSVAACGGEIVGIGNSGNRVGATGLLEEVAFLLTENPGTPEVTDEVLAEILSSILRGATAGDPEAALIVLHVAQRQRGDDEG